MVLAKPVALKSDGLLPDEALRQFHTDGFLAVEQLIDRGALEQLRAAYDEILAGVDGVSTGRMLGGITRQVMVPSMHHPVFDDNEALTRARRIVGQLYAAPTAARTYDMLIDKPAGHPHETPWHQDAGYFARPVTAPGTAITFRSVQFWLALDDADEANGCMQFVPGRHGETVMEHRVVSGHPDDEGRLIGLVEPSSQLDLDAKVVAAVAAGGVTMHLAGTPHYTGPNTTPDRRRRAYIFNLDPSDNMTSAIEARLRDDYVRNVAAAKLLEQ